MHVGGTFHGYTILYIDEQAAFCLPANENLLDQFW
jgi:hypothetical protein